ncbi:MAG: PcfJ domain-containing protein [Kiritimatiellae bacterium]|nr:PcfJ domain-containing protein [Kiritimatiellia bacterium]
MKLATLTEEERDAVLLDQTSRMAEMFEAPLRTEDAWRNARRKRTRYHVILRPEGDAGERLRVIVAASRAVGEIRVAVDWVAGSHREWFAGALDWMNGWWFFRWDVGGLYSLDRSRRLPVWPWATLAGDGLCNGSPWEWIARAARMVEPKSLPAYLAAAATSPRVEMLVRAGMDARWFGPQILARLDADPALVRYVADGAATISGKAIPPSAVLYGFRRGWPLERVADDHCKKTLWHNCPRYGVPLDDAEKYLAAQNARLRAEFTEARVGREQTNEITRLDLSVYWRDALKYGLDLHSRSVAFPRAFHRAANSVARRLREKTAAERRLEQETRAKRLQEAAERASAVVSRVEAPEYWSVEVPRTQNDFRKEGDALGNCIGSGGYAKDMAAGSCVCLFLRGPDGLSADCQITLDPGSAPRVAQLYGPHNTPPPDAARTYARRIAAALGNETHEVA